MTTSAETPLRRRRIGFAWFSIVAGIVVGTLDGTVSNSGTISGRSDTVGLGYSLHAEGGNGTVNNLAGGLLQGSLRGG